jgi:16S rRNA (cytidine1402-2'-O)-methyltransferase
LAGTLYIVGTPIGNLEDVTMRALRVLREVDLIAAEDTRRTARLLQHYSIATPTTSLHAHNEHGKSPALVVKLQGGQSIALVSDAGMPLVSDPGALLVRAARAAGVPVQVVPGPSAVTAVLAAAGVTGPYAFLGFPPPTGTNRRSWFTKIGEITSEMPAVFFEAPHRVKKTLSEMARLLGNRPIMIGRELSKFHEELVEQPILEAVESVSTRGEFVFILTPAPLSTNGTVGRPQDADMADEVGRMIENENLRPKQASKRVAAKYGLTASDVYAIYTKRPSQQDR